MLPGLLILECPAAAHVHHVVFTGICMAARLCNNLAMANLRWSHVQQCYRAPSICMHTLPLGILEPSNDHGLPSMLGCLFDVGHKLPTVRRC